MESTRERVLREVQQAAKYLPPYEFAHWLDGEIRRCNGNGVAACNRRRQARPSVLVTCQGRPLRLTAQQGDVYRLLVAARGGIVSRQQIMAELTRHSASTRLSANQVSVVLCQIRRKLRASGCDATIRRFYPSRWWLDLSPADAAILAGRALPGAEPMADAVHDGNRKA